jgi:predicted esterase
MFPTQKTTVIAELPMRFSHRQTSPEADSKPVLLFVHGFTDTASGFLRRAYPEENWDPRFEILAPNGPFPVPQKIENNWREAYAWYFAQSKDAVLIAPEVGAKAMESLLTNLNLLEREKIIIGFSQGGFLAPHLLRRLKNVKKVIGIGCLYRSEDYPETLPCVVDGIHGTADDVVPFERGQESFLQLKQKNPRGQFYPIQDLKHTMNDEARALLKKLISESI